MRLRSKLLIGFAVLGCVVLAWSIVELRPLLMEMKERSEVQERVFIPFAELNADFLHNGFGVFILEFHEKSLLSDENIERLLLLNQMPEKYELTVMVETQSVTDSSIDTLAKLTTVDSLFVDKSGLTESGITKLGSLLPKDTLSHYIWESDDG